MPKQPVPGLTTEAKVIKITDADTIWVEVTRRFAIRLQHYNDDGLIFDCPEHDTELGKKAIEFVKEQIENKNIILEVQSHQGPSLMDINSFNRIVAAIWDKGKLLTQTMIDRGLGRLIKRDDRTKTPWPNA